MYPNELLKLVYDYVNINKLFEEKESGKGTLNVSSRKITFSGLGSNKNLLLLQRDKKRKGANKDFYEAST